MSPHMPGHTVHIRAPILRLPGTHQPWAFLSFSNFPSTIFCSFYYQLCASTHVHDFSPTLLISLPTTRLLHHVPVSTWLQQPIFGPRADTLLLCPTGWLFPSESQWMQTCWFVSSSLAYIDPALFCKQSWGHCTTSTVVKKNGHESHGIQNQERLCWRVPAAICPTEPESGYLYLLTFSSWFLAWLTLRPWKRRGSSETCPLTLTRLHGAIISIPTYLNLASNRWVKARFDSTITSIHIDYIL